MMEQSRRAETSPEGAMPRLASGVDDGATRSLCGRLDRLVEDAHRVEDADDAANLTAELEEALDGLTAVIDREDRDPAAMESAAIAEAERVLDELGEVGEEE